MGRALTELPSYSTDVYAAKGVGLGRTCLNFLGTPRQPFWNEARSICAVVEGEIFDVQAIRRRLVRTGHEPATDDPLGLVPHLYEESGLFFAEQLNGAFAAAVWDARTARLILACDRLGTLPLYYALTPDRFLFGAGIRSLLADRSLEPRVDATALSQLLSFEFVLDERTLVSGIRLVPPGSLVVFERDQIQVHRYFDLQFREDRLPGSWEECVSDLTDLLRQAMRRQAQDRSEESGILLSGGLDSRVLLALLSDVADPANQVSFTFGQPGCDDARLARRLARLNGNAHHFHVLDPTYLKHSAEQGVILTDGMESVVHMHALANLDRQAERVRILFKGFLGDALLGGHLHLGLWNGSDPETSATQLFHETVTLFGEEEQKTLLAPGVLREIEHPLYEGFKKSLGRSSSSLTANRQNHFDLLQRQRRFILHGVQLVRSRTLVRTPFCDNDLVDYVLNLPPGVRWNRSLIKAFLVDCHPALAKVPTTEDGLPLADCFQSLGLRFVRQLRWRLRAAGISGVASPRARPYADYDQWLRTVLRPWAEELLLSDRALERGYFVPESLTALVRRHMAGESLSRPIGILISFELWNRLFVDREAARC